MKKIVLFVFMFFSQFILFAQEQTIKNVIKKLLVARTLLFEYIVIKGGFLYE